MKVLFIGPYRQSDIDGILSYNIIRNIKTQHSITIRPIYYHNQISNLPSDILDLENIELSEYDILIQHVKPKDCLLTNQFTKNILLPIIKTSEIENDLFIDNTITNILLDDDYSGMDFVINNKSKINIFDYSLMMQQNLNSIFDLGIWNKYKKLYSIVNFEEDKDIIYSMIRSFIFLRNTIPQEFCLCIFITSITQSNLNLIQEYIKHVYTKFEASHTINKIVIVPIETNETTVMSIHNTGDIFLDIPGNTKNKINKKIAEDRKKEIIDIGVEDKQNLENNREPTPKFISKSNDKLICDAVEGYLNTNQNSNTKNNPKKKHILELI